MPRLQYDGRLRYDIQPEGERFRIRDTATDTLTKGRFHTTAQAEEWVDARVTAFVLRLCFPDELYSARSKAHEINGQNYYADNERACQC